jgi:hypothetical protein
LRIAQQQVLPDRQEAEHTRQRVIQDPRERDGFHLDRMHRKQQRTDQRRRRIFDRQFQDPEQHPSRHHLQQ